MGLTGAEGPRAGKHTHEHTHTHAHTHIPPPRLPLFPPPPSHPFPQTAICAGVSYAPCAAHTCGRNPAPPAYAVPKASLARSTAAEAAAASRETRTHGAGALRVRILALKGVPSPSNSLPTSSPWLAPLCRPPADSSTAKAPVRFVRLRPLSQPSSSHTDAG